MGTFHPVDGKAMGTAALLHLPGGGYEIVFEEFSISAIDHVNVILVKSSDVTASNDVDPNAVLDLGPLRAATGMQDFPVPAAMAAGATTYHTVVLWDTAMKHAVAAAPLT